jgi:hypothetical protein
MIEIFTAAVFLVLMRVSIFFVVSVKQPIFAIVNKDE